MYEYLTRAEWVRIAWNLSALFLALCACIVASCASIASMWGMWDPAGYLVPDALKLARLGCVALSCVSVVVWWWAINDLLAKWAFESFKRSLSLRGGNR